MAHDVFISYSSKDKSVADATCAVLEARNVRCWMAPRDIMPGSEWGAAIIEAIGGARVMVLIYTSSSNASPQVRREVERAVARGLHVIPFRVEDVPMSPALEYFISSPHWLDALSPPLERHLEHLGKIIRAVLDAQASAPGAAEAAANAAAADAGADGWTHGPPPGAFAKPGATATGTSSTATAMTAGATARVPVMPAATGMPASRKKLLIAGGAGAAVLVVAVVTFSMWTGDGDAKKDQPTGPIAGVLPAQAPKASDPGPTSPKPDESVKSPAANSPPAPPRNPLDDAPPTPTPAPPAPVVPAKPAEPTEQDVKRFWELLAEGSPRIPRLQEVLDDFPKLADRKNPAGNTPLYEAAKAGQVRTVELLLNSGADRKAISAGNNTPLHAAAAAGLTDPHVVEQLAPGNLDGRNTDGNTALHLAVKAGYADTVRLLAQAGADVNLADKTGRTPLQAAMILDDAAKARATALALIGAGAKSDVADRRGGTPLHAAASAGDVALLGAMIDKGAKVDRAGPAGRTALHLAVAGAKPDSAKLLLARRAAVDAADDQGNTPLHLAAAMPDTSMAELLLAGGAKVGTATKEKQTALHAAAAAGNTAMVELFMRNGGAAVLTAAKPPTPVEVAEKAGKRDIALLLRKLEFPAMLQAAIDAPRQPVPPRLLEMIRKEPALAGASGPDGRNALHRCAASGNVAFASELVKINPALVKAFSAAEETPLHVAAVNKQAGVAKVLLAAGASVRATTRAGDTPLHVAAKTGNREVVQALLDAGADPAITNKADRTPADTTADAATRQQLAAAEQDAESLRVAWNGVQLEGRSFDVRAPGATEALRVRFRDRRNFTAEGDVNGTHKSFAGTYAKGSLTLTLESPEGPLFPGLSGMVYAGKVNAGNEDNRFTWKVGAAEIQFERP